VGGFGKKYQRLAYISFVFLRFTCWAVFCFHPTFGWNFLLYFSLMKILCYFQHSVNVFFVSLFLTFFLPHFVAGGWAALNQSAAASNLFWLCNVFQTFFK
jgi:hypothetical protein